jgi:RNA polymerase sigma-70 factor (ECF subfamily)
MTAPTEQDQRYIDAAAEFGPALERLARGYEAHPERRRHDGHWTSLDDDLPSEAASAEETTHHQQALNRLTGLIQRLKPQDRQIILLYLEGLDAAGMAEITGLTAAHIATKIHRIKALLRLQFHAGVTP